MRERGKQAEARKVISSIVQRATSLSSRLFAQTKAATTLVLQNGAPVPGSAEKAPGPVNGQNVPVRWLRSETGSHLHIFTGVGRGRLHAPTCPDRLPQP